MKIATDKSNQIKSLVASAIIAAVVLWIAYAIQGIAPFGDNTLLTWDMEGQYSAFLAWWHYVLTGQASLLYSNIGDLGQETVGFIGYYLSSPFNLLMFFFDVRHVPDAVALITTLKVMASAVAMGAYLQSLKETVAQKSEQYEEKREALNGLEIPFSVMYALSSYAIAYQSNNMWIDALIYLPLLLMLLNRLLHTGKWIAYSLILALAVISNYYTAYMICLFLILYVICNLLNEGDKAYLFRFVWASVVGGVLSSFAWVSMLRATMNAGNGVHAEWSALANWTPLFLIRSLLPLFLGKSFNQIQLLEVNSSYPLLYCGILSIIGIIAFFASKQISVRRKLFYLLLIIATMLSLKYMNLYLLWHGMYSSIGAPWRYAFIWPMVAISCAYEGLIQIQSRIRLVAMAIILLGYFGWVAWRFETYRGILLWNMAIIFAEFVLYAMIHQRRHLTKFRFIQLFTSVLVIVVGIELIANATQIWSQGFGWQTKSVYDAYCEETLDLLNEARIKGADFEIYRVFFDGEENAGYRWNINTIEQYTSMMTTKAENYKNQMHEAMTDEEINRMLGIRYYITKNGSDYDLKWTSRETTDQQFRILVRTDTMVCYEDLGAKSI